MKNQTITSKDEAKRELEKLKECAFLTPKVHQALDIAIDSLDNEQKKASITLEELKNKYDKNLEKALAECETGKQANAICDVANVLIDYILDNEWVDVRDRLPKKSGWYWVTQKFEFKGEFAHQDETDYEVDKEYFDKNKNEFNFTHKYIIAWRTYFEPEPYERKE